MSAIETKVEKVSVTLLLTCDEQITNKAKYVFDTFLHVLGIPCREGNEVLDDDWRQMATSTINYTRDMVRTPT